MAVIVEPIEPDTILGSNEVFVCSPSLFLLDILIGETTQINE